MVRPRNAQWANAMPEAASASKRIRASYHAEPAVLSPLAQILNVALCCSLNLDEQTDKTVACMGRGNIKFKSIMGNIEIARPISLKSSVRRLQVLSQGLAHGTGNRVV